MKLIYSSPDIVEINELRNLLEAAGIPCILNNEAAAKLAGGVPMSETMAELWVEDESRLAEAEEIKRDWKTPPLTHATAWVCPKCGEKQEPQFTSCWKCGTKRR